MKDFSPNSKSFIIFLKQCGIEKKEDQLILSILSKLGPEYLFSMYTFHATRLVILNWKMASLSTFFDSLAKEKDKLIHMGNIKISKHKYHALIVQVSKNEKSKEKKKMKEKKPKLDNEYEGSNPTDEGSNSMKKFKKKGIKSKCYYYRKFYHPENKCFKKIMDIMSQLL